MDNLKWDLEQESLSLTQVSCKALLVARENKKIDLMNVGFGDLDMIITAFHYLGILEEIKELRKGIDKLNNQMEVKCLIG